MGSYVVLNFGTPYGGQSAPDLTNDDWFDLDRFVYSHAADLNRTPVDADELYIRLRNDPHTEVWIERDPETGGIAGFVALHIGAKQPYKHTASLRIFLAPEARGRGFGSKLVERALAWARANGIKRVTATPCLDGNEEKLGFFLKHGFEIEGRAKAAVRQNGRLLDMALLARIL